MKRGSNIKAVGGNIKFIEGKVEAISLIFRLFGRKSSGKEGKGDLKFGGQNQDLKQMGVRKNFKLYGALYTPAFLF